MNRVNRDAEASVERTLRGSLDRWADRTREGWTLDGRDVRRIAQEVVLELDRRLLLRAGGD